ncbi:hypothetical protein WOLCODRAFT_134857 [Wolfiporia cocos MD-104 SS10]|uniref:Pyridoxamine 5'-phosphate oxidase putative domain-containing protein n=1 Tax=Wolfiporia cocos (strain MD-104) TaxID=742152 RepID=A0A2H3ITJ0_WOLCO|nr:hypothetical protein WOLCODRAFT_134857 [Wolfiporia cocos MD-104 SS10]
MVQFWDSIQDDFIPWIEAQHMFWVASAPLGGGGHVNLSPKGLRGAFHVVDNKRVWYEDFTGSGSETIAHIREPGNGRVTVMLCSFEGPPRIMRLFCKGSVHEFGSAEYEELVPPETRRPGLRAAIVLDILQCQTSCGYAVPLYQFVAQRPTLLNWCANLAEKDIQYDAENQGHAPSQFGEKGLKAYWAKMNLKSLDGLPTGLTAHESGVTPTHAESSDEWGKGYRAVKPGEGNGAGKKEEEGNKGQVAVARKEGLGGAELVRLLLAFVMGLAVAAAYSSMADMAGHVSFGDTAVSS